MSTSSDRIIEVCEAQWDKWKSDCSGFAKAVAKGVGIELFGQANQIIDLLATSTSWTNLGADPDSAVLRAMDGELVIGGLKAKPHGHVVIIVKSPPRQFPVAYWGRFGLVGKKNTTINWSWSRADIPKVVYFSTPL